MTALLNRPQTLSPVLFTQMPEGQKLISWEDFQRKYLLREDAYKYEWLGGEVEKTKREMDQLQIFIIDNLTTFFRQLLSDKKIDGLLVQEGDFFFPINHRKPDIAFVDREQINLTKQGQHIVPRFVIEIISTHDKMEKVSKKMLDYRRGGVQCVWHIFPKMAEVHVYHGAYLDEIAVCRGHRICSAAPALPEFALPAEQIFE